MGVEASSGLRTHIASIICGAQRVQRYEGEGGKMDRMGLAGGQSTTQHDLQSAEVTQKNDITATSQCASNTNTSQPNRKGSG